MASKVEVEQKLADVVQRVVEFSESTWGSVLEEGEGKRKV